MTIDLQRSLGQSYQVEFERSSIGEKDDATRAYIPCDTDAIIRPFGRNRLAAVTDDERLIQQLAQIEGVGRYKGTEDTYVFSIDEWEDVADVLRPLTID